MLAGPVQLIPYKRGSGPCSGAEQAAIDAVFEPYRGPGGKPVETATILSISNRSITADLLDGEVDDLFRYSELIALAGLTARHFFDHLRYSGRDDFRLIIQSFQDPARGPLITTRRRDGVAQIHYTRGRYQVLCPAHVGARAQDIDHPFLRALLAPDEGPAWARQFQAITLFNAANTDQDYMMEAAEIVLAYSAFEQLLGPHSRPHLLAERFERIWQPEVPVGHSSWCLTSHNAGVSTRLRNAKSLRSAWIEDLGILRGSVSHGHGPETYPSIWSAREHLLYAAFAFPLLLKLQLASSGRYSLTDNDRADIDAFESLLNARHFAEPAESQANHWSDAIGEARMYRLVLKAGRAMGLSS